MIRPLTNGRLVVPNFPVEDMALGVEEGFHDLVAFVAAQFQGGAKGKIGMEQKQGGKNQQAAPRVFETIYGNRIAGTGAEARLKFLWKGVTHGMDSAGAAGG